MLDMPNSKLNNQNLNISHPPDIQLVNITKKIGSIKAIDQVSMHLKPGRFHALLGENGAGKSTLVKCLMGFYTADSGEIIINGEPRTITSPYDAYKCSIGMVYQHFTLIPSMTIAENLVLTLPDTPNIINWKLENEKLAAFLETAPFKVDLSKPANQLAAGEKQKVEILKQLYLKNRFLILDEPTSVLTPDEADEVLGLLKQQVNDGLLSVLLITHKFGDVRSFADEVTVLRRGKIVGNGLVKELSTSEMAKMMLGEEHIFTQTEKSADPVGEAILKINQIWANGDNGLEVIKGINLTVHSGEIVGIAGVSGNGQRELIEVLAGQRIATSGQLIICGEVYKATRQEILKHRVFCLPEEPLKNACVPQMSVGENMALRKFDRPPMAKGNWLLIWQAIRLAAIGLIEKFSVKTPSVDTPISHLSGGNVQRTVLARELSNHNISLLIAANPCFGLDFAAVDYIHSQLVVARNEGVAVLLVSEDLDELLKLADRILVIYGGKIVYESAIADADIHEIGHCMAGH
ncbi:ABC transporter ATP-binding protein [Oscillatoriales cyanobacterium USR001]|nr:ABC transporter ATP-binding protein [Oscillatoriales cyanobacterium USR001]